MLFRSNPGNGAPGSPNTGGGGGGADSSGSSTGGTGGPGIVILRYSGSQRGLGGTVTSVTGSGSTYTANITPGGNGILSITILAGGTIDLAGNLNTASAALNVNYDNVPPTVLISTTLTNPTNNTYALNLNLNGPTGPGVSLGDKATCPNNQKVTSLYLNSAGQLNVLCSRDGNPSDGNPNPSQNNDGSTPNGNNSDGSNGNNGNAYGTFKIVKRTTTTTVVTSFGSFAAPAPMAAPSNMSNVAPVTPEGPVGEIP